MNSWAGRVVLLAIIAVTPHRVVAQEASSPHLIVRGKVISVEVESNESWRLRYQANIELHYINIGNFPVIFARQDPMHFLDSNLEWDKNGSALFSTEESQTEIPSDAIDEPLPPTKAAVTLRPKGEYRIRTKAALNLDRFGPDDERIRSGLLHARLLLNLTPWPRIFVTSKSPEFEGSGPDEVNALLKARWATIGDLALDTLEAEPIEFDLPIPTRAPETSGLVLRGKVTGLDSQPETSDQVEFRANLELELKNAGPRPILVLKPECMEYGAYLMGTVQLLTSPDTHTRDNELVDWSAWPSIDRSPRWQTMREEMDRATSPEDNFWLIQPGTSRVFQTSARLWFDRTRQTARFPPQTPWSEVKEHKPLWLAVKIEIWPNNLEIYPGGIDNPEFGRKLRDRWSKLGQLELGEGGIIVSEPMPIELPKNR